MEACLGGEFIAVGIVVDPLLREGLVGWEFVGPKEMESLRVLILVLNPSLFE